MNPASFITFIILTLCTTNLWGQRQYDVFVFLAEECPISIYMTQPLKEAVRTNSENANFYAVFPVATSTLKTANDFLHKYELKNWNIKLDPLQKLTRQLEVSVTPEVVIVDRNSRQIYYRGRVSDAYSAPGKMRHGKRTNELRTMLLRLEEGHTPTPPWPAAVGCFITPMAKSQQ